MKVVKLLDLMILILTYEKIKIEVKKQERMWFGVVGGNLLKGFSLFHYIVRFWRNF
jgi:hypothetical protein